jgi:TolB-like protein/DNA-binding winged helix-turn-helix (wHTH) protein/Tfp pilus assembly protein PilF
MCYLAQSFNERKAKNRAKLLCASRASMAQATQSKTNYQFGPFLVDAGSHELRKHGIRIKLQDLPFQMLLALIQRPGDLVSREELRRLLWPDGTFVDFDHGISSAVNKLRTALSDSARHSHYIETVGRRGYRFLYPVTLMKQELPWKKQTTPRFNGRVTAVMALGLLLAIVFTVVTLRRASGSSAATIRSVAVLPLKNLSSNPEQEYFSEGLTDELTARLASLQGLRVISATSAMQYRNTTKPLPAIAKELNVDAVVEGSVLRAGDRVRITAQLIEAAGDRHLWAESYERDERDVLTLQNDVARDIAEKIKLNLDPASRARLVAATPVDPKAHEEYLRGRYLWSRRSDFQQAILHFEAAIAADPNYAPAYAGLADCYALLSGYTLTPQDQAIPKARAAALKALELDPNLAEAHTSLALIAQNYDWDWQTADKEYRRAMELDPSYATGHQWYGEFLSFLGRFDEAETHFKRARELDPLSSAINTDYGVLLYYERRYDQAIEQFRAVLTRDPDFGRAHMVALVYVQKHMYAEALANFGSVREDTPSAWAIANLVYIYGRAGQLEKAKATDKKLAATTRGRVDPGPEIYAALGLGDKDRAFAGFKVALTQHSNMLVTLKVNPAYDPLRSDPRFDDLMRRVGLTQ